MSAPTPAFDAVLLLSFGGPEGPDEVMPFLENVTRGRGIPRERLEEVAEHYLHFGGRSPINDQCRELVAALEAELAGRGPRLPVYWGNRNWHPFLADTMARMAADGVRRAVAVATSAYSSYSACRQYREDIERARAAVGDAAPLVEKIPPYWNHPGFIETMATNTTAAVAALGAGGAKRAAAASEVAAPGAGGAGGAMTNDDRPHLVFTAHSIPMAMADACDYEAELREASALVAERVAAGSSPGLVSGVASGTATGGAHEPIADDAPSLAPGLEWDLVWQSRSGPPSQPWLEPDVCDHLRRLHAAGIRRVVLVPIGFVADHMEVLYDLDTEARAVADELGLEMTRAAAVGAAPRFVAGLRDLLACHIEGRVPETLGTRGPRPSPCAPDCCAYTPPARPASATSRPAGTAARPA